MPVDWKRYPAKWPRVVAVIRRRSGNRCEWCAAANGEPHPVTGSRVVLTTAHLGEPFATGADKHDKHDVRAENLAHLCQRCHLNHDRDERLSPSADATETNMKNKLKSFCPSDATPCCASWISGDKPDTAKGSSTPFWVTMWHKESGKHSVGILTYHNCHVMPCADHCDPPECAVPHKPEEDGYCEDYEWTCWSDGYCEHCETEWIWSSHYVEIVAHAHMGKPAPFLHNVEVCQPEGEKRS